MWQVWPAFEERRYSVAYYFVAETYHGCRAISNEGNELRFTEHAAAADLANKLNQGETMSDYPFYDPSSMLAKRNKLKAKLREEQKNMTPWDQLMEESSFSKKASEPEFKARPAVEKLKPKLLKEKITNDLNTVLALALEGLDNMNKDGVDDVYNVSKIRDLILKVNREVAQE